MWAIQSVVQLLSSTFIPWGATGNSCLNEHDEVPVKLNLQKQVKAMSWSLPIWAMWCHTLYLRTQIYYCWDNSVYYSITTQQNNLFVSFTRYLDGLYEKKLISMALFSSHFSINRWYFKVKKTIINNQSYLRSTFSFPKENMIPWHLGNFITWEGCCFMSWTQSRVEKSTVYQNNDLKLT